MPNWSPTIFNRSGSRSQIAVILAPATSFHACIWLIAKKPQPIRAPFNSAILTRFCHLHECYALLEAALRLIDHHSDDDDKAFDDHLPERRYAHHDETIGENTGDGCTDHGPAD